MGAIVGRVTYELIPLFKVEIARYFIYLKLKEI